eukprot:TRINITY_DN4031_c0_g1_i1.p1 TRINITY_DN4031_c0_g1~~TRINITY_DN4031_c0_g1_i1.p1  ORF type:complete len:377 (+),score=53.47 TRINITY_DN4031_c0_g1_i1:132-1133(+)
MFEVSMHGTSLKDRYVGPEAQQRRGILHLNYPMKHGIVTHWDDMERVWDYAFRTELRINPEERPILTTEAPLNPKSNREKTAQLMFERFQFPSFYVALGGILGVYSSGRCVAVMLLDIGDGVCSISNVVRGWTFEHATMRMDLAGSDLTEYLSRLLTARGYNFSSSAGQEIVREIKEKQCYVAPDYEQEASSRLLKTYKLPDGHTITLGSEIFLCPEALFNPSLVGMEQHGVHQFVYNSIMKCEDNFRSELFENIVLCGGTTMLPGFSDRIQKEIAALAPPNQLIKTVAPPERKYSVWIGGSILASLSCFSQVWITKEEYNEKGPNILHTKAG